LHSLAINEAKGMPPKAKTKQAPAPEQLVDNESHFRVQWSTVQAFSKSHTLTKNILEDSFLNPDTIQSRHIVISVDPAGGGALSEEAFVVWVVQGIHSSAYKAEQR
jgi:hypothetical protein